jgi:hypothetical protein
LFNAIDSRLEGNIDRRYWCGTTYGGGRSSLGVGFGFQRRGICQWLKRFLSWEALRRLSVAVTAALRRAIFSLLFKSSCGAFTQLGAETFLRVTNHRRSVQCLVQLLAKIACLLRKVVVSVVVSDWNFLKTFLEVGIVSCFRYL